MAFLNIGCTRTVAWKLSTFCALSSLLILNKCIKFHPCPSSIFWFWNSLNVGALSVDFKFLLFNQQPKCENLSWNRLITSCYSEFIILGSASLFVNTATPVHPNPSQPSIGFQLNGDSTSRSPLSLTNFFRSTNRLTWPVQSLYLPNAANSGQTTPVHST